MGFEAEARKEGMMKQEKESISTQGAPAAIGPYVQAIRSGDMVFTSGQIPLDPATGLMVPGGIQEQTERVLRNLQAVLEAAGLGLSDVVKTTVFMKNLGEFAEMNAVYARYFAGEGMTPPARSTVQVAALPKDALVEVECIARG